MSDAADRLSEVGVDPDAVREIFQEQISGFAQRLAAHTQALQSHKDVADKLPQVNAFLEANPQLKQRVESIGTVDPGAAVDYAVMSFRRQHGSDTSRSYSPPPVQSAPGSMGNGRVPLHAGDLDRESREAYIKRRLRASIHHPGLDALERGY